MEFHSFTTIYSAMKSMGIGETPEAYYNDAIAGAFRYGDACTVNQLQAERAWIAAKRPYYAVYPSIIPPLTKLHLDIDSGLLKLPMDVLCVRLPVNCKHLAFDWQGKHYQVQSILMSKAMIKDHLGMTLWIDIGEGYKLHPEDKSNFPVHTYRNFRCKPGVPIEEDIKNLPIEPNVGVQLPESIHDDTVRLCCSLCLMQSDPEIIMPDVLAKDADKFDKTGDMKFVEKAHRRGKVGWLVGAKLEVIPHVRRPHPALVWTGVGRTTPKIVFRKGSIVHRKAVENLPTGFEGKQ